MFYAVCVLGTELLSQQFYETPVRKSLISSLFAFLTAQKMNFFTKYFFSKCDQIHRKQRIWSHLLKKSLVENLTFFQCLFRLLNYYRTSYSKNKRITVIDK